MRNKQRLNCFALNLLVIFLILILIYWNYKLKWYAIDNYETDFRFYIKLIGSLISTFVCSLLLQREEILIIFRQRKSISICWELILLSVVALLLAFMKFLLPVLFPGTISPAFDLEFGFLSVFIHSILESNFGDIVLVFASGILLVKSFHIKTDKSALNKGK